MINPKVSILILNYNNQKLLSRAVKSCLNQTYKNIEILIYDDKSTDQSIKEIKKFKKKINLFKSRKKKLGIAAFDAANGYYFLFNKSKGSIICLLDSDDSFHKQKIKAVVSYFNKNHDIGFLQNLPLIKLKKPSFTYKRKKNSFLSFWPYLAPESCISVRKIFMKNFIDNNNNLKNKYNSVWLGFRMGVYSFFLKKNFAHIGENLTYYESLGESKKYLTFGKNWFLRRKDSFNYLRQILKYNKRKFFSFDYSITKLIILLFKIK